MTEPILGPELGRRITDLGVEAGQVAIWWLGQSSFVLRGSDGQTIMIDPYFPLERPAHEFLHPQPPLRGQDFGPDLVFCTHDHLDHTHPEYLLSLTQHHAHTILFLTADGASTMAKAGVSRNRMRILSAGETVSLGAVRVKVVHTKTTAVADTDHFGFVFQFDGGKMWHSGDMMRGITSIPELMVPLIAEQPDVALLTMTPEEGGEFPSFEEGADLARRIGAKVAIPSHYSCFTRRDYDPQQFAAQFPPDDPARPVIIEYCGHYIYRK